MNASTNALLENLVWHLAERGFPVGTVRNWAAGDFEKYGDGDWRAVKKDKSGKWVRDFEAPNQSPGKSPTQPEKNVGKDGPSKEAPEKARNAGYHDVDPQKDSDGDGVADASRVGIAGKEVLPPPSLPKLPNLDETERALESKFNSEVEKNTDKMAEDFYEKSKKGNFVFETDAAKEFMPEWTRPDLPPDEPITDESGKVVGKKLHPERLAFRARYNTPLHQAANAVAKKAFLKRLDEIEKLPEEQRTILVTSGGCAAGKGMALKADPALSKGVAATWDAAGEQNATENPWLMAECEKRGIRPTFLFVHANPDLSFQNSIKRAKGQGRMVDARVFADSYAEGAKNFAAFAEKNKGKANFVFAQVPEPGKPAEFLKDGMPKAALEMDADKIYDTALKYLDDNKDSIPEPIYQGATAGRRIWKGKK